MPIYEYECTPNKHRFEVIQKFSDPPVTHCTICGEPVHRLLSSPAIQFKGSGWYITDYARKGSSGESSESKSSKTTESSEKGGTDSKKSSAESLSSTGKDSSGSS
jgi:putative FmdB family regulatory protein